MSGTCFLDTAKLQHKAPAGPVQDLPTSTCFSLPSKKKKGKKKGWRGPFGGPPTKKKKPKKKKEWGRTYNGSSEALLQLTPRFRCQQGGEWDSLCMHGVWFVPRQQKTLPRHLYAGAFWFVTFASACDKMLCQLLWWPFMSIWFVKIDCHDGTFRFVPFASEG